MLARSAALPNKTDPLKVAVMGDFGTGDEVAAQMPALRARFPFELVITTARTS